MPVKSLSVSHFSSSQCAQTMTMLKLGKLLLFVLAGDFSLAYESDTNDGYLYEQSPHRFERLLLFSRNLQDKDDEPSVLTGEWAACSGATGTCINTNVYSCTGATLTGKCPGPTEVRCCPYPNGIKSAQCGSGICMRTGNCPRSTLTGLCPGPVGVACCPEADANPPKQWKCCSVECAGFSIGPIGACASQYTDHYGPTKPHSDCWENPDSSSGAAFPSCCKWYHPICV